MFTCKRLEGNAAWWVDKVQRGSVEEESRTRRAVGAEAAAALAAVMAAFEERESGAAGKRVTAGRLPVRLP